MLAQWPLVRLVVGPDGAGTVHVNDLAARTVTAPPDLLRTGTLARAVAVAVAVSRPVRVELPSSSGTTLLAAHPDGSVHQVHPDGRTTATPVPDSPCRACSAPQPLAATACPSCGTLEPHRVEAGPVARLDAAALTRPDEQPLATPAVRGLRLTIGTSGRTVRTGANVALGRDPRRADGRAPVPVTSPAMLVSKTHAFLDLADDGTLRITDAGSTNGTHVLVEPPVRLPPGVPYPLVPGTTVQLADVTCVVDLDD